MSLVKPLHDFFISQKISLAIAESCTGGRVSAALTAQAGSSAYFLGAVIAYTNAVKINVLNVSAHLLSDSGAISLPCVEAMAKGVKQLLGSTYSIAISGIAGPSGTTPNTPIGLVCFAICGPRLSASWQHHFSGTRLQILDQAVEHIIQQLHQKLVSQQV